jgi:hypothetical protein
MLIQETWIDRTDNVCTGESGLYEPFTDEPGKLYRHCMKEYGRCIGRMYIDTEAGTKAIGWVFQKRQKYDDCKKTFLLETWVTLHDSEPDRTIKHHYHFLKA